LNLELIFYNITGEWKFAEILSHNR
jgi:hypothetical protein